MSLFSSMQLASGALRAQQIGLQVVGQNIANANTPGYIREQVVLQPAPTQQLGSLLLGMGVEVTAVIQKIDHFLEERLRTATSDRAHAGIQEQAYLQLEEVIGELTATDLSTAMTNFFSSIHEVLNQPESSAVRNLAILRGQTLADDIARQATRAATLRANLDTRVVQSADSINRLTTEIRDLNIRIAQMEGGDVSNSDAVGLRDQRLRALTALSEIVDIKVTEQMSGGVNVMVGGEYLVAEGHQRSVKAVTTTDRGQAVTTIHLVNSDSPLNITSGELAGLMTARDEILGGYLDSLNEFASAMIYEFNKAYSSGQGLVGMQEVRGVYSVDSASAPLDAAGLPFTPVNGSFEVLVKDRDTGITQTTSIRVDLNGLDEDDSLNNIVAQLNAINGISAAIDANGRLTMKSESSDQEFAFANDTSGLLAALGINVFFTGDNAHNIGVSQPLRNNPMLFAASGDGIGADTKNAELLAGFLTAALEARGGDSVSAMYARMTGSVTQASTVARNVAEGARVFQMSLEGQKLATSGVNLDEEIVNMIQFQRAYQLTARYIAEMSELLNILINL